MKILIMVIAISLVGRQAEAWGGLFNRFSPEVLTNMGYGAHGGYISVCKFMLIIYNPFLTSHTIFYGI